VADVIGHLNTTIPAAPRRSFVGQYRAITPIDVAALAVHAAFDDVRILGPKKLATISQ
jgi:hypothetical protein